MVMDFVPQFAEINSNDINQKGSQESKVNIEGSTDTDPRAELEEYKKSYLEALKDLDPTSILDDQREAKIFAKNCKRTCCESCYRFGCYDSPKAHYDSIVGKRDFKPFEEDPETDNPQDNNLFNIDLEFPAPVIERIVKKRKIDSIDGFEHTNFRDVSPPLPLSQATVLQAEEELMNISTWNEILHHCQSKT